ncbi:(1-_4)-alpha-D-glucan synthase (ADP-glucose) [Halobellus limi]|uniref:(1->4)-alpha-D-glucan synthase (ADP-glucose) n=2 Tax=Halobellus limi TaxID=699433 RepID=A0A1H5SXK3_9EURY|nr:(1->4)-alpha-D-glucan synthase (ADP-glucose) [Halobellus limi]
MCESENYRNKMSPKVLMLGWGFPPNVSGGLDTHVGELFDGMRERGLDVELVLPSEYAPDDRDGIVGVPTGDGDIITRVGRMSSTFAERAEDADIIHTHDWFGYGPGSRAKSNTDVEWVTTFHSLSTDRNLDPPKREVETERRLAERADHLIAVSELTASDVREQYGGDCEVIYNGFSECETTGRDYKSELGIDGEMLFFVGRHTDQKGIAHLVYAMEKLRRDDVTLVMGGSGHLTDQLKRFAELLGVDDRIEWVGYVPEEELGDYYASADLFVSPSLAEPFGITITEALSAGTRVVATRSGVNEVLSDDCVVEVTPDSTSIAEGIERGLALEEPPVYEPITWDEVVEETVAFYERIL